jgi:hypothetical protein
MRMKEFLLKCRDPAHELLLPFIQITEKLLEQSLHTVDKNATCRILPAVDLGFPHDVVRIAGGFPTGCYVEWNSSVPFIPIDTTVNIDTSSIFVLEDDISEDVDERLFEKLKANLEKSSYIFNFHKGNHFISFGRYIDSNIPVLIIHSNEKEFKYQFNGLMPSDNNWYRDDVKILEKNGRYLRFLIGKSAELFIDIAKSLEEFNIIRHRFVAHLLTKGKTCIRNQEDHHHYFMPTRQSIAIGCFPVRTGTAIPIFSKPGRRISIFEAHQGGGNVIHKIKDEEYLVLAPHGWGKTCKPGTIFSIDYDRKKFTLSGRDYEIRTLVSLGKDERLELRNFSEGDENSPDSLFSLMKDHCPGIVKAQIRQVASFTKDGFMRHEQEF